MLTVPDADVSAEAATLLPVVTGPAAKKNPVTARLLLSADAAGSARVTAYDASGKRVLRKTVARSRDTRSRSTCRAAPRSSTSCHGVRRSAARCSLTGDGATVIPLTELLTKGLVPQISPGPELTGQN